MAIQAKELKVLVISDDSYRTVQATEVAKRLTNNHQLITHDAKNISDYTPDIVIGAGEKTADSILEIKKLAKGSCHTVTILDPRKSHAEFDLIVMPGYEPSPTGKNILTTTGLINNINKDVLALALQSFSANDYLSLKKSGLHPPYLTMLIGGKHIGGNIGKDDAVKLAEAANKFASKNSASILVATCKRTEKNTVAALKEALKAPNFIYDYNGARDIANPYILFLALADAILVTGDSLRMCSEACSTGKPVFIYDSENIAFRYKNMHRELFEKGYASPHLELAFPAKPVKYLDEAGRVAEYIKSKLF